MTGLEEVLKRAAADLDAVGAKWASRRGTHRFAGRSFFSWRPKCVAVLRERYTDFGGHKTGHAGRDRARNAVYLAPAAAENRTEPWST